MDVYFQRPARGLSEPTAQLASFASQVYGWLSAGLGLTALTAFMCYYNEWFIALIPYQMLILLSAFGISMAINLGINQLSFAAAGALFLSYAFLEGLMFGVFLPLYAMQYGGDLVWAAFATAAGLFASATVYGRVTKQDLTGVAQLLNFSVLALVGISLILAVASFFVNVAIWDLFMAYAGLIIFVGLLVTDAQQIRLMAQQVQMGSASSFKLSLLTALRIYINVVLVFTYLLRILASGRRSDD